MGKVSKKYKKMLEDRTGDDEAYHSTYDAILEDKIRVMDPDWMEELDKLREKHGCSFWYA